MSNQKPNLLSRGELRFWIPIIGLFVAGAIAYATLRAEVKAQAQFDESLISREQANKGQFGIMIEAVQKMDKTLVKIETNQGHIMRELGISN